MKTYFHFVRRDLKDNAMSIALLVVLTVLVVAFKYWITLGQSRLIGDYSLGLIYFMFFLVYGMSVWGNSVQVNLARGYLQSLPLARVHMFCLCIGRCLLGGLPLFLHLAFLPLKPAAFMLWNLDFPYPFPASLYLAYLAFVLVTHTMVAALMARWSVLGEDSKRQVGRLTRLFFAVQVFFVEVGTVIAIFSWISFLRVLAGDHDGSAFIAPTLALGYFAWILRRTFYAWRFE